MKITETARNGKGGHLKLNTNIEELMLIRKFLGMAKGTNNKTYQEIAQLKELYHNIDDELNSLDETAGDSLEYVWIGMIVNPHGEIAVREVGIEKEKVAKSVESNYKKILPKADIDEAWYMRDYTYTHNANKFYLFKGKVE